MDPCPPPDDLAILVAESIDGPVAEAIGSHVRGCARCRALLDALSDDAELGSWLPWAGRASWLADKAPALERLMATLHAVSRAEGAAGPGRYSFLDPPRDDGDLGRLGAFPVRAELGRGGMGIVLLGLDEALQRPVALKVLRPELADEDARRRFVREARAAARVKHDHVVAVYGVADPPDGLPYCVMEYLAGPSLADRVRAEGRLAPREAAAVAAQVADGLAAAHAAGLVHRDIKPSNILFDLDTARAKLADFGLARAVAAGGPTRVGDLAGTPDYMSPEQARGADDLGPASDVYSLGASLYETLTGEPPFRGPTHSVLQRIRDDEPRPPRALNRGVPRDLETIALKCLAKEPCHRYAGAAELARDLRRFLAGEPVAARPIAPWGRLARWARRRPALAALGTLSTLAIVALAVGGVFYSLHLRTANRRAEASLLKALDAVNRMLTRVGGEGLADVPETALVRRDLLADAQALLSDLRAESGRADDPAIGHAMALAHRHLGRLHDLLGEPDAAESEFRRAIALHHRLDAGPADRRELAVGHGELGRLLVRQYRTEEAAAQLESACALLGPLADDPAARRDLALCSGDLGVLHLTAHRMEEAERLGTRAVSLLEGMPAGDRSAEADLARVLTQLGTVQVRAGRGDRAEVPYRRALVLWERLAGDWPGSRSHRAGLAECGNGLGSLLIGASRVGEARPPLERALALREQLARDQPRAPGVQDDLARAHNAMGHLHLVAGRPAEAAASHERARAIRERLARDHPRLVHHRRLLAETYQNLALSYQNIRGRAEEAAPHYAKATSILDALRADFPAEPGLAALEGIILTNSGLLLAGLGRAEEALPRYGQAVGLLGGADGPPGVGDRSLLLKAHGARAQALQSLGRHSESAADWGRVVELADATNRDEFRVSRCFALLRAGDLDRAEAEADALAGEAIAQAGGNYYLARFFARAAHDSSATEARAEGFAARAVALLDRADARGFFRDSSLVDRLERDPDFDPLRSRDDYRALLGRLRDRCFPADPFAH